MNNNRQQFSFQNDKTNYHKKNFLLSLGYQNIRLNDGKLEVYVKNEWGTVCSYGWDDADAKVACRSLGLPRYYDLKDNKKLP